MSPTPSDRERMIDLYGPDIISRYTRAQGIEDGVLVNITTEARRYGIACPVALTAAASARLKALSGGAWGQDIRPGLLVRTVLALRAAAKGVRGTLLNFSIEVDEHETEDGSRQTVSFKSIIGPGDTAEPVITIFLADETD